MAFTGSLPSGPETIAHGMFHLRATAAHFASHTLAVHDDLHAHYGIASATRSTARFSAYAGEHGF